MALGLFQNQGWLNDFKEGLKTETSSEYTTQLPEKKKFVLHIFANCWYVMFVSYFEVDPWNVPSLNNAVVKVWSGLGTNIIWLLWIGKTQDLA